MNNKDSENYRNLQEKVRKFSLVLLTIVLAACGGGNDASTDIDESLVKQADSVEATVKAVCSSCHIWVPPDKLDKYTWKEKVLPVMAAKMGIYELDGVTFYSEKDDPKVPAGIYPDKPTIEPDLMRKIINYFYVKAPESLPAQQRNVPIGEETRLFDAMIPSVQQNGPPIATFVKIVPEYQQILAGVAGESDNQLVVLNKDLSAKWIMDVPSAPVWCDISRPNQWLLTCMGSVFPSNDRTGQLLEVNPATQKAGAPKADKLARPVQAHRMGNDYLINNFGHLVGDLSVYGSNGNVSKVLRKEPGCIRSLIYDWNKDGKQDILALFAQGIEGIYLYTNEGNGNYSEKRLMELLPVNGSSWFEIEDVNKDGHPDIVYACGDNADYSVILKPYHGIYIYLNDGKNQFKQSWFYPVNGAYRFMLRDFDLDGDLDMVSISFFADYLQQPEEALLYFENTGNLTFKPFKIKGYQLGRWLTMDAGDIDGDGDEDVVLGNFSRGPQSFMSTEDAARFSKGTPLIMLVNRTK
jgi:hypothetical protein